MGIIEAGFPFCYIDKFEESIIGHFFSLSQVNLSNVEQKGTLKVCDTTIYFYNSKSTREIKEFNYANNEMNKICFRIGTSGTTGKRKVIYVTYNSIHANIKSFSNIFKLDKNDVVLSSSPITFDVFAMDLFFTFASGAALLFIADNQRFDHSVFSKDTFSVTFLQITPTIFKQYGLENIQKKILHSQSSLK